MTIADTNNAEPIAWLKGVLGVFIDSARIPERIKTTTKNFVCRSPDWYILALARATQTDFLGAWTSVPDLAEQLRSDTSKQIVKEHMEVRRVVPLARGLRRLLATVLRLRSEEKLPTDAHKVELVAAALALVDCTALGREFAAQASCVLGCAEDADHLLSAFEQALMSADGAKLGGVSEALAGGDYARWVLSRLDEAKRRLGLDILRFDIRYGQRTPQWDSLWGNIIKGGVDD